MWLSSRTPSTIYRQLDSLLQKFHTQIGEDSEVEVQLVNSGQAYEFYLSKMDHNYPPLIVFRGATKYNQDVVLIQHVNQLSLFLIKMPRRVANK